ncbi:UNKNOWN [Stylonychia lemnae]|uniref:Uncharacterized protein n=1 Tax=Stylonychia lemnae TaxID=5949 RepID=A0A078A3Q5_STYLE|nr:UNKNOWN [Stylonychia lemnae]|eukprot:CDW76457.1 UNKNOWN [Stylonychia lemnae]
MTDYQNILDDEGINFTFGLILYCTEKYHDLSEVKCISIIQNEIKYLQNAIQSAKENDFKDYYQLKIEGLESDRDMLKSQLQIGQMSKEKYLKGMVKAKQELEKQILQVVRGSQNHERISKRIELINNEIKEIQENIGSRQQVIVEKDTDRDERDDTMSGNHSLKDSIEIQSMSMIKQKPNMKKMTVQAKIMPMEENLYQVEMPKPKILKEVDFLLRPDDINLPGQEVDEELLQSLEKRLDSYAKAVRYLMTIDNKSQAQELLEAAEKLKIVIRLTQQGRRIDILKVEPELTPVILFGETQDKRQRNQAEKQFFKWKNRATDILEQSKLEQKQDEKNKLKAEASNYIDKAKVIGQQIQQLKQCNSNPWMPVPKFQMKNEEIKTLVMNEDLRDEEFRFQIDSTKPCVDKGIKIDILMNINESEKFNQIFKINNETIKKSYVVQKPLSMKVLFKKDVRIIIKKGDRNIVDKTVKFKKLETNCQDSYEFQIASEFVQPGGCLCFSKPDNSQGRSIKVWLQLRKSLKVPEFEVSDGEEYMQFDIIHPAFNLNDNQLIQSPQQNKQQEEGKMQANQKNNKQQLNSTALQKQRTQNQSQVKNVEEEKILQLSSGLNKQDCQCHRQQNADNDEIDLEIFRGRQTTNIMGQIQSGQLTEDQYKQNVLNQIAFDKKLEDYFKQSQDSQKLEIVQQRIKFMEEEIAE